jgi:hypothetical protein
MRLFRRGARDMGPASTPAAEAPASATSAPAPTPPAAGAEPLGQDTSLLPGATVDPPCAQHGCPNGDTVRCHYVDRRGRQCDIALCPSHRASVGGMEYCRRHAGTIAAIGYFERSGMPDLDNRAPSLVNWVARDLDGFITETLIDAAGPGERFVREPVVSIHAEHPGVRRYERLWKLVDHTGVRLVVAVFVSGEEDVMVRVRVGTTTVAEGIPPWIERRSQAIEVSAATDRAQRDLFYGFLQKHILAGVQSQRAREAGSGER